MDVGGFGMAMGDCGWELVVESMGNWFCEMDVMSCVDNFFHFPSVVKTV